MEINKIYNNYLIMVKFYYIKDNSRIKSFNTEVPSVVFLIEIYKKNNHVCIKIQNHLHSNKN